MTTSKKTNSESFAPILGGFIGGAVGLLVLVIVLHHNVSGNVWLGATVGGVAVLLLIGFGTWRSLRRPDTATVLDRTVALGAERDERDQSVLQQAAAAVGYAALPLTALSGIAIVLDYPAAPTITILFYVQLAIAVGAFIFHAHRS